MTILPSTKPKKIKEKREEWREAQGCGRLSSPPPRKMARVSKPSLSSSSSSLAPIGQSGIVSPRDPCKSSSSREEEKRGEEQEGPNSDDEYDRGFRDEEAERDFENRLREERGLEIKKMKGDGACLFRGVSQQIYGDEEMHGEVRRLCLDYMEKNREHFEQFITEDFAAYIARKRRPTVHGNHVELQAISEIYNRPIEIYEYNINPINVFHPKSSQSTTGCGPSSSSSAGEKGEEMNAPIRLSYHGSTHYNAVIDPRVATVGVGLGLPAFDPGLADRQLIAEAMTKSEMHQIEQAMLKDKMSMTDWERTEEDIKDQVLRESYLQYARSVETPSSSDTPSTSSSLLPLPSPKEDKSEKMRGLMTTFPTMSGPSSSSTVIHPSRSPQPCSSRHGEEKERRGDEEAKKSSLYEEMLMMEALDWNEDSNYDSSLAEAIIMSQQTFLSELQRKGGEAEKK